MIILLRRINFPLLLGSIIVIFLLIVAIYPGLFTSNDPLFEETPKYIETKENGEWVEKFAFNPMPPNKDNIFGTDDAGRDVYARLVYGTRNTLKLAFLIALFRMIIALPLGMAAGMGVKLFSGIIKVFNTFFTAIPMLLFSFIVLNIDYFRMLEMDKSIIAFAVVLTIVGWAKLAGMIEDSTRLVMDEDFIEGEIAIGKTKLQIAYQNVLPHILPTSVSLFFKEMGMALFLIAQLAVLNVFVGVTRRIKDLAFKAAYEMALEPEWGGSLSRIAININKFESTYWMSLYPILVFSIAIIGMNLTGEGLRIEFQKRNSRVISSIRKAYYIISPRLFIAQLMDIKKHYKSVIIKVLVVVMIIAYFVIPWHPSTYKFDIDQAKVHLNELVSEKYQGRATGTYGGYLAGEYIINTLKGYGYEIETIEIPYTDTITFPETGEEVLVPKVLAPVIVDSGWIRLIDDRGEEKTYYLHKDFKLAAVNANIYNDMSKQELNYKGIAANAEKAANIPEDKEFFAINEQLPYFNELYFQNQNFILSGNNRLNYDIEFIPVDNYDYNTNTYLFKSTTILTYGDLSKDLENGYRELEINLDFPRVAENPGRIITAVLPGKGRTKENPGELIIIGASYDGIYNKGKDLNGMTATAAATALEVARIMSQIEGPLEKSIQFIFWDNDFDILKYSSLDGSNYYHLFEYRTIDMALSHGYYYLDITYPGFNNDKYLNIVFVPAQRADANNYLIGLQMEKRLKQMNVKFKRLFYDYNATKALDHMRINALTSISVGNPSTWVNGLMDNLEDINYERMEDIGQIIIDSLTMKSHIMSHKALEKENNHD